MVLMLILHSAVSFTSFAWLTRIPQEEMYESGSAYGGTQSVGKPRFVDEGLPAPIIADPVSSAVEGLINVKVDGKYAYFYDKPLIVEGRVLIPFRELFEYFEMSVSWDGSTKTAKATNDDVVIEITVDDIDAIVNGNVNTLDVPAKIIDGRTYVPIRFVAEALEYNVNWSETEQTVLIDTKGAFSK